MSNTEDQATDTTKKSPIGLIFIIFAIFVIGAVVGFISLTNNAEKIVKETPEKIAALAGAGTTVTETEMTNTKEDEDSVTDNETTNVSVTQGTTFALDLEKASTPRILGNPEAPIKISEHSSFTCGGCAMFHKNNFKLIKEEYVDTGKAYIVFDDFPRNMLDIKIGAVARCVPEKAYFDFVQLLFETQKTWLNDNYATYVKQNARLTGASSTQIDTCLNSKELHEALAHRQEAATKDHGVKSTPTLVINDKTVVSGLDKYATIKAALEAALVKPAE